MAAIRMTFNGKPGTDVSLGDPLQDLVLTRAIEIIHTKALEALTPQEADLIAIHFRGHSLESLSFKVEGPVFVARKVLAATR
jgi:hypothetical protein